MGLERLPQIARELVAHGRAAATQVALVRWGSTDWQETVVGTLADIPERARRARLEPPVVTGIGDGVALRERLAWVDGQALPIGAVRWAASFRRRSASGTSTPRGRPPS